MSEERTNEERTNEKGRAALCDLAPVDAEAALRPGPAAGRGPRADCVLCGEETEWPADQPGGTLCPRCTWQQAQRGACSG